MILILIIAIILYSAMNFYVGQRIFMWLQLLFPKMNALIFIIVYGLFAITTIISFLNINLGDKLMQVIGRLGDTWMGIFFYAILLFVLSDSLLWFMKYFGLISSPISDKVLLLRGFLVITLLVVLFTYGKYHANQILQKDYQITIKKDTSLKNLNVVLISDLHLGYTNNLESIKVIVNRINKLEPDIVLIAGDIFNGNYEALYNRDEVSKQFKQIESTYGVYGCLGNHDAGDTYQSMVSFLEKSNVQLLNDEYKVIDDQFVLVGRKDSFPIGSQGNKREELSNIISEIDMNKPIIVLDHQPANYKEYNKGIDLILSGHTHKGQIFPANLITKVMYTVDYGYFQEDLNSPQVIVTSGVGTWGPPLRIGSDSEIAKINIDFK